MPLIELTPENIKNNKYEGVFINRVNKEKALENLELRFENIQLIAQHNIILATKCIVSCFLPQRDEILFLKKFAIEQIQKYEQPEFSASAFVALAKLGAWIELSEQYHLLKSLKKEQKQKLTPAYLQYLKYNGFEKEQSFLFTMLINLATSFEEAERFFYTMEMQHVLPTAYTYTSVMHKANNWENAQIWWQKAIFDGFEANEVSYNILISLSKDFEQGKELLKEMYEKELKPNEITYNTLISLSKDFEQGKELLKEMYEKGLKPNEYTYNTLISLSKDFEQGKELLKEMYEKELKPNEINYNTLISLSKDFEQGKELLKEMYEKGLKPNEYTYNTLISLSKDFEQGKELLKEMYEKGLKPNEYTYNTLISLSKDFEQGKELLKEMYEKGLKPNEYTYNTLISLSKDFEQGKELLKEMYEKELKPNEINYNTLISLSKDFEQGKELLKEMYEKGLKPNEINYNTLISLSKDFEQGKELLKEMYEKGLKPNEYTYNNLISLSKDFEQGKELLEDMYEKGLKPNQIVFNTIIKLSNKYEYAHKYYLQLLQQGYEPDVQTFMPLLGKLFELSQLLILFEDMQKFDVTLDEQLYIKFLEKMLFWEADYSSVLKGKNNFWGNTVDKLVKDWLSFSEKVLQVDSQVNCKVERINRNQIIVKVKGEIRRCYIYFKDLNWVSSDLSQEVKIGHIFQDVYVKSINPLYGIGLSLKKSITNNNVEIGNVVECEVTGFNYKNTTIFVKVKNDNRKASIFYKEVNWKSYNLKNETKIGKTFNAKVIDISEKYGISLSLKK